jgi:membrane protein YdbS with pleckstrin-like domain
MNCPKCDAEIADDALFCHRCGANIGGNANSSTDAAAQRRTPEIPAEDRSPADFDPEPNSAAHPRNRLQPGGGRPRDDDDDTEVAIWKGGYSPKAMITVWIGAAFLSLVAIVGGIALGWPPTFFWGWVYYLLVILAVWGCLFLRLLYLRLDIHYELSSQRFVHERGILRRVTDRIEVIDIDDVQFEQNLIERIVGVGKIRLVTSDRSHKELLLIGIDQVKDVANKIDNARRKERVRRGLHIEAV